MQKHQFKTEKYTEIRELEFETWH